MKTPSALGIFLLLSTSTPFLSAQTIATATTVTSSANPATAGTTVTFTVTVKAATPSTLTGPVRLTTNGNYLPDLPLINGVAQVSYALHGPPKTLQIIASYLGDTKTKSSTSAPLNQVIAASAGLAPTTITVASSQNPAYTGQIINYTATVVGTGSAAPAGSVTFFTDGPIGQTLPLSGAGTASGSGLFNTAGTFPITANYSGDAHNLGSASAALGQIVQAAAPSGPSASQGPLQFVAITPCRIADTRLAAGDFGGPSIANGQTRSFNPQTSACGISPAAAAYSLNITAAPKGPLNFMTVWPAGQPLPDVSLLNSLDGRIKANAAIVPAGTSGAISVYAIAPTAPTDVVIDIDGYFLPATPASLDFYPLTPCRLIDTRNASGPLGGPYLPAGQARAFPVQSSACKIPATAQAYSLNMTAIPAGALGYLTTWPTGTAQPVVSTLNSLTGAVEANAAIVAAGAGGSISIFVDHDSDLVVDINGYFAPPAAGGLSLFTITPCRIFDSRQTSLSPFPGVFSVGLAGSTCGVPAAAAAGVVNVTAVPPGPLQYLSLWPAGATQPTVSTLNAADGAITSNMAVVPTSEGIINSYASDPTQLLIDIASYFAP